MYAIIATGGKQYKVAEGDIIKVEKLGVDAGETYTFDQVLAVNNDKLVVGNPTVEGATVTASVIGDGKAKKVVVYKYKRKTGYHKKNGHRQQYTAVKIDKINAPFIRPTGMNMQALIFQDTQNTLNPEAISYARLFPPS